MISNLHFESSTNFAPIVSLCSATYPTRETLPLNRSSPTTKDSALVVWTPTHNSSGENHSLANDDHHKSSLAMTTAQTSQPQEHPAAASSAFEAIASGRRFALTRQVDHTYRDYSIFKPESPLGNRDEFDQGKKLDSNFPAKLHAILSNPEYAHIISWMPHGRSWKIMDKELLLSAVCAASTFHTASTKALRGR